MKLVRELLALKKKHAHEMVELLENVIYTPDNEEFEIDECSICMEKFVAGNEYIRIPNCRHIFHIECTYKWFESKNQEREQRCPFCN